MHGRDQVVPKQFHVPHDLAELAGNFTEHCFLFVDSPDNGKRRHCRRKRLHVRDCVWEFKIDPCLPAPCHDHRVKDLAEVHPRHHPKKEEAPEQDRRDKGEKPEVPAGDCDKKVKSQIYYTARGKIDPGGAKILFRGLGNMSGQHVPAEMRTEDSHLDGLPPGSGIGKKRGQGHFFHPRSWIAWARSWISGAGTSRAIFRNSSRLLSSSATCSGVQPCIAAISSSTRDRSETLRNVSVRISHSNNFFGAMLPSPSTVIS